MNGYSQNPYGGVPQQPQQPQQQAYGSYAPAPVQQQQQQHPSYGPPPGQYGYAPVPQMPYGMPMNANANANQKSGGLAVALELIGGSTLQTFGIGHLYAGNIGMGLGLMFGYWALTAVNIALCFILVGFVTWPLTWVAFMILSAVTANNAVKRANGRQF